MTSYNLIQHYWIDNLTTRCNIYSLSLWRYSFFFIFEKEYPFPKFSFVIMCLFVLLEEYMNGHAIWHFSRPLFKLIWSWNDSHRCPFSHKKERRPMGLISSIIIIIGCQIGYIYKLLWILPHLIFSHPPIPFVFSSNPSHNP